MAELLRQGVTMLQPALLKACGLDKEGIGQKTDPEADTREAPSCQMGQSIHVWVQQHILVAVALGKVVPATKD